MSRCRGILAFFSHPYGLYVSTLLTLSLRSEWEEWKVGKDWKGGGESPSLSGLWREAWVGRRPRRLASAQSGPRMKPVAAVLVQFARAYGFEIRADAQAAIDKTAVKPGRGPGAPAPRGSA